MTMIFHDGLAWTEARVELLKALAMIGKTAREIANELGVSRNAIISKINRTEIPWPRREFAPRARVQQIVRRRRRRLNHVVVELDGIGTQATDLPAEQPANPLSLFELTPASCRWPCAGEGLATVFCGGDAADGMPYCTRHCRMAYQRPKPFKGHRYFSDARPAPNHGRRAV